MLITPCHVCQGFDPATTTIHPPLVEFNAIWDTGATGSVITQRVVDACGLKPIGMVQVHGVHSTEMSERYLVNIRVPNGVGFVHVPVTKGMLPGGSGDVLIGMDIITRGDFSITNKGGSTVFSFRYPSLVKTDFVEEDKKADEKMALPRRQNKPKKPRKPRKTFGKKKKKK